MRFELDFKLNLFLLIGFFCLISNTVKADNITLPLGSVVSRRGIDNIMNSKTVEQFLEAITKDGTLRVIAVDRRIGKRTTITIPEKYWTATAEMTKYFDETPAENLNGIYVCQGCKAWTDSTPVILVKKDILLKALKHEYLHHLISSEPKNGTYLFTRKRRVSRRELNYILKQAREKVEDGLNEEPNNTGENRSYSEDIFDFVSIGLIRNKKRKFEEIEIELYLLRNRNALQLDRSGIVLGLMYIQQSRREIIETSNILGKKIEKIRPILLETTPKRQRIIIDNYRSFKQTIEEIISFNKGLEHEVNTLLSAYPLRKGDANFDGIVNKEDFYFLKCVLSDSRVTLTICQEILCDVDGDGEITQRDLVYLLKIVDPKPR